MSFAQARSIRARLLIGMLLALAVILASAAWWSYAVTKHESDEIFSARLATSARVLEALVANALANATIASPLVIALPKELEQATDDRGSALGHPYETKIAFQVWREDGTLLARSTSASARPFAPNEPGFSLRRVDGEPSNVFVLRSGNVWIQVAEKDEVRDELIHDLGVAVMTPLIVGAAILLVLVNVLVVYALAPLRDLAAGIERSEPAALEPLALDAVPAEVAPVVHALNDLLARVRQAFEHERRFTDAAAHELRTPLAALKIHADNLARAETERERAASMRMLRQGLDRTLKLAAQMLDYSRAQSADDPSQRVPLHLSDLVAEALAGTEPIREARHQTVALSAPPEDAEPQIVGEPGKLGRLVANLLDNAARYAPEASAIRVSIGHDADTVELAVENDGPAIPAGLRERVFEPYYRIPGTGPEGSGLGLAIVREVAAQHGATVDLGPLSANRGTIVRVRFPSGARTAPRSAAGSA